jgi:hypothetical protein
MTDAFFLKGRHGFHSSACSFSVAAGWIKCRGHCASALPLDCSGTALRFLVSTPLDQHRDRCLKPWQVSPPATPCRGVTIISVFGYFCASKVTPALPCNGIIPMDGWWGHQPWQLCCLKPCLVSSQNNLLFSARKLCLVISIFQMTKIIFPNITFQTPVFQLFATIKNPRPFVTYSKKTNLSFLFSNFVDS